MIRRKRHLTIEDLMETCSHQLNDDTTCPNKVKVHTRGLCRYHAYGYKLCQHEGCKKTAEGKTSLCVAHGGGYRCQYEGCTKKARSKKNPLCKAHGGGDRCQHEGCDKSAYSKKNPLCKAHGGGNRCQHEGCDKAAQGNTHFCIGHGGGDRCQHEGCDKSAAGTSPYCKGHGGGDRCQHEGCDKSAQGKTSLCIGHGGGDRCAVCTLVSVRREGFLCYVCRIGTERMKQLEVMVKIHLESDTRTANFSYRDQTLPCSPNRRRPDFVYVLEDRIVTVECDENCHRHYNRECEIARITELMEQCHATPLILIRFNPTQRGLPQLTNEVINAFTSDLEQHLFHCKFIAYPAAAEYDPVEEIAKLGQKRAQDSIR
jgi:hypothetical protein